MRRLNCEKALDAHRRDGGENFNQRYDVLKERLLEIEYTQTSAGFAGGNDHGPAHIRRVLENLDKILGPDPLEYLSIYELWLTLMSVIYHDVGLLKQRAGHPEIGAELLLGENNTYLFDRSDKDLIATAIFTHGSKANIAQKCLQYPKQLTVKGYSVRMELICALVRLADELDEDERRADSELARKKQIEDEQKYPGSEFFWRFSQRITGIDIPPPGGRPREISIHVRFEHEDLQKNYEVDGAIVSFIPRFLDKIVKINKERNVCCSFFPDALKFSGLRLILLPFPGQTEWGAPEVLVLTDGAALDDLVRKLPRPLVPPSGPPSGGPSPSSPRGAPASLDPSPPPSRDAVAVAPSGAATQSSPSRPAPRELPMGPETRTARRLLLLADLQVGMPSQQHNTALASLPAAVARSCSGSAIDAVVLLGDIAWSGQDREYEEMRRTILDPLRSLPCCSSAPWFAVPGNHDVDCDASYAPVWDNLGTRRDVFFDESEEGQRARKPRVPSFLGFQRFVASFSIHAPLPSEQVSSFHRLSLPDEEIGLLLLNTAWLSDCNVRDFGRIPAPLQSFQESLKAIVSQPPDGLLVVGHHPIDAFRLDDRARLRRGIREHHGIYLHGHVAHPRVDSDAYVLRELGLGTTTREAGGDPFVGGTFVILSLDRDVLPAFHHWTSSAGAWEPSDGGPAHGARRCFSAPWRGLQGRAPRQPGLAVGPLPPRVDELSYLNVPPSGEWRELIRRFHLLDGASEPRAEIVSPHEVHFFDETPTSRRVIVCLSGSGRLLAESEVLEASNKLDLEDYDSYTIFTFGEMADEALAAYQRLAEKKPLRIITRRGIIDRVIDELSPRGRTVVETVDQALIDVRLVFLHAREFILLSERMALRWIELYSADGDLLADTHDAVAILREFKSSYKDAFYGRERIITPGSTQAQHRPPKFDEKLYREAMFQEFNSVRYAPLAAFGVGFSHATLTDLYVDTSAQMEETDHNDSQLARALDEMMEGIEIDPALREQLRHGVRNAFGVELLGESDVARRLYQKHGSVLILGNPGSGKTFFAKHQLLSYCRPPATDAGWYAKHLPVFVSLAEAAKHAGDADLLDLAAQLPKRSSLAVPAQHLHELFADGRLALFFDGLDEVTSLAQRGSIAERLCKLLDRGRAAGNRFVLTSRPSAVQVVHLTPDLPSMTLCGLDEPQIRALAQRVLRAHVSEGSSGPKLSLEEPQSHQVRVIEQLLADIHQIPGVRRLATNPLLLTLLIMVYVNSGAPTAKRHRIYQQAAQTLVTIRSRDIGQEVLSEKDLRRRLGSVALEVFRGHSTIPSMNQVLTIMRGTLSSEQSRRVTDDEVRRYLQQVADATGIIVLHPEAEEDGGHVTFMHYSFAEYYAALGLESSRIPVDEVARLSRAHRWREVITLYAGLLGDFGDLKAFIDSLLRDRGALDNLTLDALLFAFDCALESDVPPDAVLEALIRECRRAMSGILRFDHDLRHKLGKRLERLHGMSRSHLVLAFLRQGLTRNAVDERAAYIDLFAQVLADEELPADLLADFATACDAQELSVFRATCRTARHGVFSQNFVRSPTLQRLLEVGLSKTLTYQVASLQCIEAIPALARIFQAKIEASMRSPNSRLATSASRAYIEANTSEALDNELHRHKLLEALRNLARRGVTMGAYKISSAIDRRVIERFLSSHAELDKELGLYLLPWLRREGAFVRETIMNTLRNRSERAFVVAALGALRLSEKFVGTLRVTEMAMLRELVEDQHRDTRIAAVRALLEFGRRDPGTIDTLCAYVRAHQKGEEFNEAVRALVWCGHDNVEVLDRIAEEISRRVNTYRGDPARRDLEYLLECAALCDWNESVRISLCKQLLGVVNDKREPLSLRVECLSAFVMMCKVEAGVINHLLDLLEPRNARILRLRVPAAAVAFLARCRRRLDSINMVFPRLDTLRAALEKLGHQLTREKLTEDEIPALVATRDAIGEIEVVVHAFSELDTPPPRI